MVNYAQAATSPVYIYGELEFESLGEQGAQTLAKELLPQDTFCDYAIPPEVQAELDAIQDLADSGDIEQANEQLDALANQFLLGFELPSGKLALQDPYEEDREVIQIFLKMAELQILLGGGDGSRFMDAARTAFRRLADKELGRNQIDATMRITQEAQLLGEKKIADKAIEKAKRIIDEALEAAINSLDPCLPNPKILDEDVREMFDLQAKAQLLGVESAMEPDGRLHVLAEQKATAAAQQITHVERPDLFEPPEDCPGYLFTFNRTVSGTVSMVCEASTCGSQRGPWTGSIALNGSPEPGFTDQTTGEFSFMVPENETYVETRIPTSGSAQILDGSGIITDDLLLTFILLDDTTAEISILSTSAGQIIVQTKDLSYPVPHYGTVWTDEPKFTVVSQTNSACR
jgi:hypothetical protein